MLLHPQSPSATTPNGADTTKPWAKSRNGSINMVRPMSKDFKASPAHSLESWLPLSISSEMAQQCTVLIRATLTLAHINLSSAITSKAIMVVSLPRWEVSCAHIVL